MQHSNRILFNTMAIYLRIIVNIFVALFTTRYVLEALGADDFGIFGLVGSVVGLLTFLNSTMAGTTQRFLNFHKKQDNLNYVFSASIVLHFLIGIILVILLEVGGFLFLDNLNIDDNRKEIAYFVFHCIVIITFFSVIATPYQALISANEDMSYIAIFSIVETFIKLGIALFLFITPYDRFGTYAVAMMILAILMRITQRIFCKIRYSKVIFSYKFIDKKLTYKMLIFTGWNFVDIICTTLRFNGLPILINLFFGTAMNAVYNLASQVSGQVNSFSSTLLQASAPQIVSGIAGNNLGRSKILTISSCKFQLFLVSLFSVPLILNIDYVLSVWLKQVPEYLSIFCCLTLLNEIIVSGSNSLASLVMGKGFIRSFKIALGACNLIMLVIAYILLKIGYPPYSIYVGVLIGFAFANISHIYFAHRHVQLNVPHYLKEMSKVLAIVIFAFFCTWVVSISPFSILHSPLAKLLITTMLSSSLMLVGFWFALSAKEKQFAKGVFIKIKEKIRI